MAGTMRALRQDPAVLEHRIKPGTLRRTMGIAAPYTGWLLLLAVVVVVNAGISITFPLIYRRIINDGILRGDTGLIVRLAVLIALLGVLDAALGLLQTYLGTRVGAAVVVALRTRLFAHIQRMPLAFFARTQTGALVNRLFSDTMSARSAFTDILSTVAGNIVTVVLVQLGRTRGKDQALLTERRGLNADYIEYVVRHGLKAMPPFVPSDLSEPKLKALVMFLAK